MKKNVFFLVLLFVMGISHSATIYNDYDKQPDHYYLAKVKGQYQLPVYQNPFLTFKTKIIGELLPGEEFLVLVGYEDAECRRILKMDGLEGFVKKRDIKIIANYNDFQNQEIIKSVRIEPENIFLQKHLRGKELHKSEISSNFLLNVKTGKRDGKDFLLFELKSNNAQMEIFSYRSLVGLVLPLNFRAGINDMELAYFDNEGLFIDAFMHKLSFEDNLYFIVKKIARAISGIDADQIKDFAELLKVGEFDIAESDLIGIPVSSEEQIIDKEFGSFENSHSMSNPPATTLQLAIPIYGSIYDVKNYFRFNDIKMLLGTYLAGAHYCALIFGINHSAHSEEEIGDDPSIHQIVGSYYNGNKELHFVYDGSKLKVKLPDNQFYSGWHALDRVNESSNTFEYWSPDGPYQFIYYNDEHSEYITLQTWYSDGKTMKYCKDTPCN